MAKVIGIDLGTSNSAAAVVMGGNYAHTFVKPIITVVVGPTSFDCKTRECTTIS